MISASACEKADKCLRKYFLDRDIPFVENEASKLGHEVHDVAEAYHKEGTKPNEETEAGKRFMPALPYLPPPLAGRAEGKFSFKWDKVEFIGRMDLRLDSCRLLPTKKQPVPDEFLDWPCVLDYKSTKEPRKTMLEGAGDFLTNKQTIIYAFKALQDYPEAPGVFMRWIYLRTAEDKAPKAYVSDCALRRGEVTEAFMRLVWPLANGLTKLRRIRDKIDPMRLPFNADWCTKYGPKYACAHVDKCNLSVSQQMEGRQEYVMDDLLAELQAEMGGSKGVNPAPVKAQEQDKSTFEPEDEEAALERKLAEAKAAKAAKAKAAEEAAKARASQLDAIHTAEQAGKSVDKLTDAEIGAMVRAIFKAVR